MSEEVPSRTGDVLGVIRPGDVVVLRVPDLTSDLAERLSEALPAGARAIILTEGMEMEHIDPERLKRMFDRSSA